MLFPIMFPRGELGYDCNNSNRVPARGDISKTRVSPLKYYLYRIANRGEYQIQNAGKVFQQFILTAYLKVEDYRLRWIETHQANLRSETYQGLRDFLGRQASHTGAQIGRMVVLPASHNTSPRHRYQQYMDALAGIRVYGRYDLFVTFTCNPKWPEIQNNLGVMSEVSDRVDIACRVFKMKLDYLIGFMVDGELFGKVMYWTYVIEFQRRRLPHAHIVLTMCEADRVDSAERIDQCISAELPPPESAEMRQLVSSMMIHKPCANNSSAPCMADKKCKSNYPRPYSSQTLYTGPNKRPVYKRTGSVVHGARPREDNCWVVPFNPVLVKKMNCHVNVEAYTPIMGIKYLFKYLHKGAL